MKPVPPVINMRIGHLNLLPGESSGTRGAWDHGLTPETDVGIVLRGRAGSARDHLLMWSRRSLRELVAERAAQDLADIGLRQLGPEVDVLRDLVGRQLALAEGDDFVGGERRILLHDEERNDLARLVVGLG